MYLLAEEFLLDFEKNYVRRSSWVDHWRCVHLRRKKRIRRETKEILRLMAIEGPGSSEIWIPLQFVSPWTCLELGKNNYHLLEERLVESENASPDQTTVNY